MTTREDMRALVKKAYETGNYRGLGNLDCDKKTESAQLDIDYLTEQFMSLPALRLAEKAEEMNEEDKAERCVVRIVDLWSQDIKGKYRVIEVTQ